MECVKKSVWVSRSSYPFHWCLMVEFLHRIFPLRGSDRESSFPSLENLLAAVWRCNAGRERQERKWNINKKFNFKFPIDIKMFMRFVRLPVLAVCFYSPSFEVYGTVTLFMTLKFTASERRRRKNTSEHFWLYSLMLCRYTRAWLNFKMSKRRAARWKGRSKKRKIILTKETRTGKKEGNFWCLTLFWLLALYILTVMHYTDRRNKLLPTTKNDRRTFSLHFFGPHCSRWWCGQSCKILDWAAVVERNESYLKQKERGRKKLMIQRHTGRNGFMINTFHRQDASLIGVRSLMKAPLCFSSTCCYFLLIKAKSNRSLKHEREKSFSTANTKSLSHAHNQSQLSETLTLHTTEFSLHFRHVSCN